MNKKLLLLLLLCIPILAMDFGGSLGGGGGADNLGNHTATQTLNLTTNPIINVTTVSAVINNAPDATDAEPLFLQGGNKTGGTGDGGNLNLVGGASAGGITGFVVVTTGLFRISTGPDAGSQVYNIRTEGTGLTFESNTSGTSPTFKFKAVDFDGTDSITLGVEADATSYLRFIYSAGLNEFRLSTSAGDDLILQAGHSTVLVLKVDRSLEITSGGVATTDATVTTAHTFPTVSDTSYTITSTCTMQSSSAANGGLVIRSAFKNVSGTVTQIGATQAVSTFEENAATAVAHVISGTNILTRVTGIAATDITWNCGVTFTEAS